MISTNNPEINVEELMQRIRTEVAQRKAASCKPENQVAVERSRFSAGEEKLSGMEPPVFKLNLPELSLMAVQPAFQPKSDGQYHINDLLCYHDEAFITAAYRTLLRRSPDTDGYLHYFNKLRNGCAKVDILGRLRYSTEGRAVGVKISGLAIPFLLQQVYHIPVFGRFVQILSAIWHLPHLERNQRTFENHTIFLMEQAQSHFSESCRKLNQLLAQLEQAIRQLQNAKANQSTLDETRQLLTQAVEIRAERHELTALTNHLVSLLQACLRKEDLQPVEQFIDQLKQNVEELNRSKANQSTLDETRQLLIQAVETRAERHELTALTNHLVSLVQACLRKEDLQSVEQFIDQLKQNVEELNRSKADQSAFKAEQIQTRSVLDALQQALNAATLQDSRANQSALDEALLPIKAQTYDLKRNLLDQDRRLGLLLEEARKRLPEPISTEQIETMLTEDDHRLDAMYASFEDHFRGTREDIKGRISIYLPIIQEVNAGSAEAPVLDLGCGRGEWLELLRDNGLVDTGVDINRVFLDGCRELRLDVVEKDVVAYLRSLKPNSVGTVTAFHLIEHLPIKTLIALMDETIRVLLPGGLLILETPNPQNVLVGSCYFYMDPTHIRPLPRHLCEFLLEARGFIGGRGLELNPFEDFLKLTENENAFTKTVNHYLLGPRDIAIIGKKA